VLRGNRLRNPHPSGYFTDGPFRATLNESNHLSPPRFGDRVEDIGGGRGPRHGICLRAENRSALICAPEDELSQMVAGMIGPVKNNGQATPSWILCEVLV